MIWLNYREVAAEILEDKGQLTTLVLMGACS